MPTQFAPSRRAAALAFPLFATLAVVLVAAVPAGAAETLTVDTGSPSPQGYYMSVSSTSTLSQSFKATEGGELSRVVVSANKRALDFDTYQQDTNYPWQDLIVEVHPLASDGTLASDVLASEAISPGAVASTMDARGDSGGPITVQFAHPAHLIAGESYALVFKSATPQSVFSSHGIYQFALSVSGYADGLLRTGTYTYTTYDLVLKGYVDAGPPPDTTSPTIDLRSPFDGDEVARGSNLVADFSCADEDGGSGLKSCTGDAANSDSLDTSTLGEKSFTVNAEDNAGNKATTTAHYTVVDRTKPTIDLRSPADGQQVLLGSSLIADFSCVDEDGGSGLATCAGDVADGAALATSSVGLKGFTVQASDDAGNRESRTNAFRVVYNFAGFFSPVNNLPSLNVAKAGSAIPVKFSLGGNQGLDVLALGYPKSQVIACNETAETDGIEETVSAGVSGLRYDADAGQYVYVWKTEKAWAGTCRQLVVKLADGTSHRANFSLR